jgi:hypothetical protein
MSKSRKLIVVALAIAAMGALVVTEALGATTFWKGNGTADPAMTVKFRKVKVSGDPAKIKEFDVQQLHFVCHGPGAPDPFRSGLIHHGTIATVRNGKFSYSATTYNSAHTIKYNTHINGEFVSARTATGTVKQRRTVVSNPSVYCVSNEEPWKANKQ